MTNLLVLIIVILGGLTLAVPVVWASEWGDHHPRKRKP